MWSGVCKYSSPRYHTRVFKYSRYPIHEWYHVRLCLLQAAWSATAWSENKFEIRGRMFEYRMGLSRPLWHLMLKIEIISLGIKKNRTDQSINVIEFLGAWWTASNGVCSYDDMLWWGVFESMVGRVRHLTPTTPSVLCYQAISCSGIELIGCRDCYYNDIIISNRLTSHLASGSTTKAACTKHVLWVSLRPRPSIDVKLMTRCMSRSESVSRAESADRRKRLRSALKLSETESLNFKARTSERYRYPVFA